MRGWTPPPGYAGGESPVPQTFSLFPVCAKRGRAQLYTRHAFGRNTYSLFYRQDKSNRRVSAPCPRELRFPAMPSRTP